MLALLIASQLAAADVSNRSEAFSGWDYPDWMLMNGESGIVLARMIVSPDGQLRSCEGEVVSVHPELTKHTCKILTTRAKFSPATWSDGTPVLAVYRQTISYVSYNQHRVRGDLAIDVAKVPGREPLFPVHVALAVEPDGRVVDCKAVKAAKLDEPKFQPYVSRACLELTRLYKPVVPLDSSGKPVRSVQDATVDFRLAKRR